MAIWSVPSCSRWLCAALLGCVLACDGGGGADAKTVAASVDAPEAAATPGDTAKKPRKDRGDASMTVAGVAWTGEAAKATLKGSRLTIKANRTDMTEGAVTRQELHLVISDYKGPGDYETGIADSRFLGVGLDVATAKAAASDDAKTTKVAADSLSAAKHVLLSKAKVHIDSASEAEIVGTFSWTPSMGMQGPEITGGKFRALVAQPKP